MEIRPLGSSGLSVGCVGLGAMPLSLEGRPSEPDAIRVIHAALDAGVTLIDTANAYCPDNEDMGHNEALVGKAMRTWDGPREQVVVATKGGLHRTGSAWNRDGHPNHLKTACEKSLKDLGVEAITLYQLHAPDENVPFEDSVGALADLRSEGKIVHAGLSNVSVEQIEKARKIVPIVSVQNRLNVFEQEAIKDGVVGHCARNRIAFLAYSAVGGHRGHVRTPAHPALRSVAEKNGLTPYQVCLAWLLALSEVVVPIPGASKVQSVQSSAAAASVRLDSESLDELANAFPAH